MNLQDQVFPWKRYWSSFGEAIHCGDSGQGFLTDPEDQLGRYYNKHLLPIESIFQRQCFVLCGEPAMGKTCVLDAFIKKLRETEASTSGQSNIIYLEFRRLPDLETFKERCFQSAKWKGWLQSKAMMSLIIDGLDEGLIRVDGFLPFLIDELKDAPRDRLQLGLSCRTLDWQRVKNHGDQLLSLWPRPKSLEGESSQQSVYTLCPLRQSDASLAAEQCGIDASEFISAVYRRGVASLAARPYTLKMLLQEFTKNHGFPASRRQLYENFALALCSSDHDPDRIEKLRKVYGPDGVLSSSQLLKVASRLAACLMLGGKYAIHIGPKEEATPTDLPIESICGLVEDADGKTCSVDQRVVLDTLATAIFSDRGPNCFGFDHQTMVESLTARYVQAMPLIQLRELFCQHDASGEYVVPQLAQAAAWLSETRPDFMEHVLHVDPETLLRSETTNFSDENKRRLVGALLEGAKNEEIFDDRNNYYSGLKHPGIAEQLRAYITDRSLNVVVRRMALAIARECVVTELFDEVLWLTENSADCEMLGSAIGHTLSDIATDATVLRLAGIARGEAAIDPQDDLKGCALRALLRSRWTLTDALPHLTPPKEQNYLGSYGMVLQYEIPSRIRQADLIPALEKMLTWPDCFSYFSAFRQIADAVLVESMQHLDDEAISQLAVKVWIKSSRDYSFARSDRDRSKLIQLLQNHETRLTLVKTLLNSEELTKGDVWNCVCWHEYHILVAADFPWLLTEIENAPERAKTIWAEAIAYMLQWECAAKNLDLFLEKLQTVPALREKFQWVRAWEIDEPMARKSKADWLTHRRREERWKKQDQLPDPQVLLVDYLAKSHAGDYRWWVSIYGNLYLEHPGSRDAKKDFLDITTWPGWLAASADQQEEIRQAARQFLLRHSEDGKQPGKSSNYASAGNCALWLLRDDIQKDPELLRAVRQQWIPVLVDAWANDIEQRECMAQLAYEVNPQRTKEYLSAVVRHESGSESGHCFAVRNFRRCWDHTLSELVLGFIISDTIKPAACASLVEFLVEVDDDAALQCLTALSGEKIEDEYKNNITVGIISGIFCHSLAKHWTVVWPMLIADRELAKKVILRSMFPHGFSREQPPATQLSDQQIGELYRLVAAVFPPENDPKIPAGVHQVTAEMEVSRFRNSILGALVMRATPEACAVLRSLARDFPKHGIWIRWQLHEAQEIRRRRTWIPPSSVEIITMAKKATLRRVETAHDLAEVVLESLRRLQERLNHSPNPIADSYWRFSRSGARREKFEPLHEEDIASRIASWLQDDLQGRGAVLIGREIQPTWSQKTDIQVAAIATNDRSARPLTVIIEVKGCWNRRVRKDLKEQLVERYLALNKEAVGIYLVGWFVSDRWKRKKQSYLSSKTYEDARAEVQGLAAPYNGIDAPEFVTGVLIDFRIPK